MCVVNVADYRFHSHSAQGVESVDFRLYNDNEQF